MSDETYNSEDFRPYLRAIIGGGILSREDSRSAFEMLFSGGISEVLTAGFLSSLAVRGESVSEIIGAAEAMRGLSLSLSAPAGAIDIVGTGGDAKGTLNISTASAFVVAGAGVVVAKHGNRAVTSSSGSADVLESLGIPLESDISRIESALGLANIGFLFARSFHPRMKYISPVRQELGVRTIFNILGPLCNPAGVRRLLLGVYSGELLRPMAETRRHCLPSMSGLCMGAMVWMSYLLRGSMTFANIGGVSFGIFNYRLVILAFLFLVWSLYRVGVLMIMRLDYWHYWMVRGVLIGILF